MKKAYRMIGAAVSAALLLSACQNQNGKAGTEQSGQNVETDQEQTAGAGNGAVVGSNFISQSSQIAEIPIGSFGKIELPDYEQVNVTMSANAANTEATDQDVDSYIRSLLQSELKEVTDRGAQKGDTVTVDYEGLVDGSSFSGNKGTDYPIVLGAGQMLQDFETALYGAKAGDKVTAEVNFPEDYTVEEVAGKTAQFHITVKNLQEPSVLDEAFIQAHTRTGASSEEEYREEIKERIHGVYENQLKASAVNQALNQIASNAVLEPSEAFQSYLYEYYKQDLNRFLETNNMTMDDYKEQSGLDDSGIDNAIQQNVQNNITSLMVMRQIAEDQNLTDSENMKTALTAFLAEVYDTEVGNEELEQLYGSETSMIELQAVVFEYLKDHVNISVQEAESVAQ